MIFKVSQYRNGKEDLLRQIRKHGLDSLSFYCACVGFPVAAALVFCIEEWPEEAERLEKHLEKVREFYGYDAIER